jgi:sulfatase modifying factor 1
MKGPYELLRHGRYILPCCLIAILFLSACAEQKSEAKKKQLDLATANDMPKQADHEIIGKDGAKMLLIPAGNFMMGSSTEGRADEEPVHQVSLDAFYLDKYEVTNKLFQKFVRETSYETTAEKEGRAAAVTSGGEWEVIPGANWRKPEGGKTVFESNREEHPVVSISWYDAEAYCRWADKRLPTEAEFEYASRAGTRTIYWWGDGNPGSQRVANIADESAKRQFPDLPIMAGYDDGYERSAPVGSFDPNPWGLHDMIGNVSEWTADWYDEDYYRNSPERNPTGPFSGKYKVLRGGSWHNGPLSVRAAYRRNSQPGYRYDHFGYRCAKTPSAPSSGDKGIPL